MSSLKGSGSTWAWRKLRAAILERDAYVCHWCQQPANTVDHLIPRIRGGTDDPGNLAAACTACNSRRGQEESRAPRQAAPSLDW